MQLSDLQGEVQTLIGAQATANDRLTTTVITDFLNDDYIDFAEDTEYFSRTALIATHAPAYAVGMVNAAPNAGDTVTVNGVVYTYKTAVSLPGDVLIGSSPTTAMANLANAITASGDPTTYGAGTLANPYVTASSTTTPGWVTLTATVRGTMGNALTLTTSAPLRITLSSFTGGVDATYAYPEDLIKLRSVRYGSGRALDRVEVSLLNLEIPDWQDESPGTPRVYYRPDGKSIGFYPPTDGTAPLVFDGICVPCDQSEVANGLPLLANPSDVPAFPWRYHKALAYGAVCRIVASGLYDIEDGEKLMQGCGAARLDLVGRCKAALVVDGVPIC